VPVVLLAAAIVIRIFSSAIQLVGEPLTFKVRVVDQERGSPSRKQRCHSVGIRDAGVTDADGYCTVVHDFPATGTVGRSGVHAFWHHARHSTGLFGLGERVENAFRDVLRLLQ